LIFDSAASTPLERDVASRRSDVDRSIALETEARYVRKTLSFSKSDFYHEWVARLFIIRYNFSLSLTA
jgi:hypothetical protein